MVPRLAWAPTRASSHLSSPCYKQSLRRRSLQYAHRRREFPPARVRRSPYHVPGAAIGTWIFRPRDDGNWSESLPPSAHLRKLPRRNEARVDEVVRTPRRSEDRRGDGRCSVRIRRCGPHIGRIQVAPALQPAPPRASDAARWMTAGPKGARFLNFRDVRYIMRALRIATSGHACRLCRGTSGPPIRPERPGLLRDRGSEQGLESGGV